MRKVVAGVVALAALTLLMPSASARHVDVRDPNDVEGRLDIRRVDMRQGPPRKWVIKTYEGFHSDRIFDRGYLLVYFDTFGSHRADYYVLLRPTRDKIKGNLWRDAKEGENDFMISSTRVRRANRRTISTTVPFKKMRTPKDRVNYRWHVRTIYSGPNCRRICIDRAPETRWVIEPYVQPLPVADP
ncbi:MAG: hypothetical protein M3198_03735 [Actinomycetota bacterium]|nr:hypothetical protein [Actinomycetota bacterium]